MPPCLFLVALGSAKNPKRAFIPAVLLERKKKSEVKKTTPKYYSISLSLLFWFPLSFKKLLNFLSVSGPFPLDLCVMFWVFSGFYVLYIWMKTLQMTCSKKKDEYEKKKDPFIQINCGFAHLCT